LTIEIVQPCPISRRRSKTIASARDLMRIEPARDDWSACIARLTDDERRWVLDIPLPEAAGQA
jgi:hypothetical protein